MLSMGSMAPATIGMPRPDEIFEADDDEMDELEQLKELYGREIFVKEQLQKRLKSETEAKQELSQQFLDLTRAKDYANLAASTAKATARQMKRIAISLIVVSLCLCGLLTVVYFNDLADAKKLQAAAQGASQELQATKDKLQDVTDKVETLGTEKTGLEKDLVSLRQKLSEAQREQERLQGKLDRLASAKDDDQRDLDLVALTYAVTQKEHPQVNDEALLDRVAAALSRDKEDVRGLLDDYTRTGRGALAKGVTAVLQGEGAATALGTLDQAILQETRLMKSALVLAAHLAGDGGPAAAAPRYLATALALDPTDSAVRLLLAEAQVKAGATDDAVANYRALVTALPDRSDVALRLGHLLERQGKSDDAGNVYRDALMHNPDDRFLLTALAGLEVARGDFASAVQLLERALSTATDDTGMGNVHFNLSFAYYGLGQSAKALEHCTRAKELGASVGELEAVLHSR